jgi:hypothetical protein
MRCCRIVLAASLVVLLAGPSASAGPARQAQPLARRTLSGAVRAACDAAYAVTAKMPGVSVQRRTGTFRDEALRDPVFGCGLTISGSFARAGATGDAAARLRRDFQSRAWREMVAYSADGTDGTSFAFRHAGVACLVRGTWDGGADNGTSPAMDRYRVAVFCASPEFPEDRPL